jgi:hypothetical protein
MPLPTAIRVRPEKVGGGFQAIYGDWEHFERGGTAEVALGKLPISLAQPLGLYIEFVDCKPEISK